MPFEQPMGLQENLTCVKLLKRAISLCQVTTAEALSLGPSNTVPYNANLTQYDCWINLAKTLFNCATRLLTNTWPPSFAYYFKTSIQSPHQMLGPS